MVFGTLFLLSFGFSKSMVDNSLIVFCSGVVVTYFLVYVDDIVLMKNDSQFLDAFISCLAARFSLKERSSSLLCC